MSINNVVEQCASKLWSQRVTRNYPITTLHPARKAISFGVL